MKIVLMLETPDKKMERLGQLVHSIEPENSIEYHLDSKKLLERLKQGNNIEFIALDYLQGDGKIDGSKIISKIRDIEKELPIVVTADKGDVQVVSKAISQGATNFLVMGERLEERVKTLLEKIKKISDLIRMNKHLKNHNRMLQESVNAQYQLIGSSPQIKEMIKKIKRVAKIPRPLLIVGERGTGKELIARMIHTEGNAPESPLVCINCAAFTDTLLESELFGYEKGAFTGAEGLFKGKFEQANGGTIFFDEIGSMSLPFQQKILRVVEYGKINRVGGTSEIPVNIRIIGATNANLDKKMARGEFLPDLYDRLSFEIIQVPPLRDRKGDIELLAQYFLNKFMMEIPAFQGKRLSDTAIERLKNYPFPGNIRELKNIIERAAYRDTTNDITPEDLDMPMGTVGDEPAGSFENRVSTYKKNLINDALQKAKGNQAEAARLLGLDYHKFRYYYKTVNSS